MVPLFTFYFILCTIKHWICNEICLISEPYLQLWPYLQAESLSYPIAERMRSVKGIFILILIKASGEPLIVRSAEPREESDEAMPTLDPHISAVDMLSLSCFSTAIICGQVKKYVFWLSGIDYYMDYFLSFHVFIRIDSKSLNTHAYRSYPRAHMWYLYRFDWRPGRYGSGMPRYQARISQETHQIEP